MNKEEMILNAEKRDTNTVGKIDEMLNNHIQDRKELRDKLLDVADRLRDIAERV